MHWILLFCAGIMEMGWAVGLKYSEGFSRFWPTVWTILAMALSLFLLGKALKVLPVGTAYAIWTGIGAVGVAIWGIILFGESCNPVRLTSIALIIIGIAGLRFGA